MTPLWKEDRIARLAAQEEAPVPGPEDMPQPQTPPGGHRRIGAEDSRATAAQVQTAATVIEKPADVDMEDVEDPDLEIEMAMSAETSSNTPRPSSISSSSQLRSMLEIMAARLTDHGA